MVKWYNAASAGTFKPEDDCQIKELLDLRLIQPSICPILQTPSFMYPRVEVVFGLHELFYCQECFNEVKCHKNLTTSVVHRDTYSHQSTDIKLFIVAAHQLETISAFNAQRSRCVQVIEN